jgi:hypothetical protein
MPTFDWRTDEGEPQQDAPLVDSQADAQSPRWLIWLEVTLIIGLITFVGYQQISRWLETLVANVRESPRAAFAVWLTAVSSHDQELYRSLLNDSDPDWYITQQTLFTHNLLFDRPPFGLQASGEPVVTAVDLDPNLTAATVYYTQTYQLPDYPLTQLQQTAVFQLHDDSWLLSAPGGSYWGQWHTDERSLITLVYPDRDAVIGKRLADDLDNLTVYMCAQLDCPADFSLWIPLRTDPSSLLQMADQEAMWDSQRNIPLPTPSLVGVPQDEAGYQLLYRGYAAQVLSFGFTDVIGWECCQRSLFYEALMAKQLAQLGLRDWPWQTADYHPMLQYAFDIPTLSALWSENKMRWTADEVWQIYTFVDFLVDVADAPVPQMLSRLATTDTFRDWMLPYVGDDYDSEIALRNGWLQFVYAQTRAAQQRPPLPPNQLLCVSRQGAQRYDLIADGWTQEMQFDSEAITVVGRFETGVVFYDIDPGGFIDDGPMSWTILPQSGERFDVEFDFPLAPMTTDDNAPGTAALLASSSEPTGSIYQLLDLSSCTAAGCEMTQLRRLPAWSPDGRYTLATLAASAPPFHVLLGNSTATAMREIDEGTLPFWLDETTFGYLTHRDGRSVIVTANVDNPQFSQTLLSASDLLPALIQDKRPETVAIRRIAAAPPDGRWLFIEAITADLHNQYIFAFDRETGEITLRLHLDDQDRFIAFRFSPDGRYWTLTTHARNDLIGTNWALYLHDIAHNETKKLAFRPVPFAEYSYDWSADGRWLLKADSGVIQLINPDDDYFKLIFYDGAQCTSAVWLPTSP